MRQAVSVSDPLDLKYEPGMKTWSSDAW